MASGDHVAMSMLAMAETMRVLQPPKFKMAVKCARVAIQQTTEDPVLNLYFRMTKNMTRSSRQHLRQMQSEVQAMSKEGACVQSGIRILFFSWMDSVPMTIFACLMTIVNSMLQCNYERALKYYAIGMRHVHEFSAKGNYCVYLREMDFAERHFSAALKVSVISFLHIKHIIFCNFVSIYFEMTNIILFNIICRALTAECMEVAKAEDLFRLHGLAVLLFSILVPINIEGGRRMTQIFGVKSRYYLVVGVLANRGLDITGYEEAARREKVLLEKEIIREDHDRNQSAALIEVLTLLLLSLVYKYFSFLFYIVFQWFEGDPMPFLPKDE
uniref:Cohesin loading complex subunit SCC4 homolog n=1 Tax=Heterorhabditis bacteriophora TaxID=37862 RepID=A0A1I7WZT0_HETBA